MSPIKIVSKALELFLRSLPVGSYYQLIGFGTNFKKYDDTPKKYSKEKIENSLKIISSLMADLGGTDIVNLRTIFSFTIIFPLEMKGKNTYLFSNS